MKYHRLFREIRPPSRAKICFQETKLNIHVLHIKWKVFYRGAHIWTENWPLGSLVDVFSPFLIWPLLYSTTMLLHFHIWFRMKQYCNYLLFMDYLKYRIWYMSHNLGQFKKLPPLLRNQTIPMDQNMMHLLPIELKDFERGTQTWPWGRR